MSWVGQGPSELRGWSKQISPGQCRFRFNSVGGGLKIGKMVPRKRFNTGIMATVSLALALEPHNSVFPYMSLVLPEWLLFHWSTS